MCVTSVYTDPYNACAGEVAYALRGLETTCDVWIVAFHFFLNRVLIVTISIWYLSFLCLSFVLFCLLFARHFGRNTMKCHTELLCSRLDVLLWRVCGRRKQQPQLITDNAFIYAG